VRAQGFDEVTGEGKISTGLDEDGDALGEADDEARNDGAVHRRRGLVFGV
jgi:hypothetical protein